MNNCVFSQIATSPQSNLMYGALRIDAPVGASTMKGNQFLNIGDYVKGGAVIQLYPSNGTFSNNIVHTNNGKYQAISAPSGWTLTNNTILP